MADAYFGIVQPALNRPYEQYCTNDRSAGTKAGRAQIYGWKQLQSEVNIAYAQAKQREHQPSPGRGIHLTQSAIVTCESEAEDRIVAIEQRQERLQLPDVNLTVRIQYMDEVYLARECGSESRSQGITASAIPLVDHTHALAVRPNQVGQHVCRRIRAPIVDRDHDNVRSKCGQR
jgi:hypothetical protein